MPLSELLSVDNTPCRSELTRHCNRLSVFQSAAQDIVTFRGVMMLVERVTLPHFHRHSHKGRASPFLKWRVVYFSGGTSNEFLWKRIRDINEKLVPLM